MPTPRWRLLYIYFSIISIFLIKLIEVLLTHPFLNGCHILICLIPLIGPISLIGEVLYIQCQYWVHFPYCDLEFFLIISGTWFWYLPLPFGDHTINLFGVGYQMRGKLFSDLVPSEVSFYYLIGVYFIEDAVGILLHH